MGSVSCASHQGSSALSQSGSPAALSTAACAAAGTDAHVGAPYPLFIYLEGARVVVVGAGAVAERKIATLLEYGAVVTVIAPEATESVRALAKQGRVEWLQRPYREGDLEGAILAMGATSDESVNARVHAEASSRNQLVNVVDVPPLCNCIVPSIMRRGRLQVAVSTAGAAPSVAREIRHDLEQRYPAYWETYVDVLADVRVLVKERVPGPASVRTPLFEAVSAAGIEKRIAAGEEVDAESLYREIVAPLLKEEEL